MAKEDLTEKLRRVTHGIPVNPLSRRPSPTLAHINRVLATSSGQDRAFMILAYSSHIVAYVLRTKTFASKKAEDVAMRITKLGGVISDARVLYRLFGLLPIISWSQAANDTTTPGGDPWLGLITRLQIYAMLVYYPLEHTWYLASKGLFDIAPEKIGKIAMWSCRFWAAYVALQFGSIFRRKTLLERERKDLVSTKSPEASVSLAKRESALYDDLMVQSGYLPLTAHWSIPGGILPEPVYVGVFGTIAAIYQLKMAWKATA